jgi:hypothetical protein
VATSRRNIKPNKGIQLYNKILKEFSKVNDTLPQDRKLSISERRRYVTEKLYPQYKGTPPSRVGVKAIRFSVFQVLDTIIPKEGCDVNYISPSAVSDVGWFEIDDFIRDVLPKCIFIKIDAGEYGSTKIFNTLNYNYTKSGVKDIVDKIRDFVNNDSGVDVSFTGEKKLRKGKANDGTTENYYIEFVLVVNSQPIREINPIVYEVPREERKKVTSVKNAILMRLKDLNLKKKRRKNARKTAIKNVNKLKQINKRQAKSNNPQFKNKLAIEKERQLKAMQRQLDNSLRKGHLTQDQYDKFSLELLKRVLDNRKQGGII